MVLAVIWVVVFAVICVWVWVVVFAVVWVVVLKRSPFLWLFGSQVNRNAGLGLSINPCSFSPLHPPPPPGVAPARRSDFMAGGRWGPLPSSEPPGVKRFFKNRGGFISSPFDLCLSQWDSHDASVLNWAPPLTDCVCPVSGPAG